MRGVLDEAEASRTVLLDLADRDAAAFGGVMAAFKMPKETDAEKAVRSQAIQEGYSAAAEVPLEIAKRAAELMELAREATEIGNAAASSDGACAAQALSAAVWCRDLQRGDQRGGAEGSTRRRKLSGTRSRRSGHTPKRCSTPPTSPSALVSAEAVRRFEPGESVALRESWEGLIWAARPATVVDDTPVQTMLFIPAGIRWMAPFHDGKRLKIPQDDFELVELLYDEAHVLSFSWPNTHYAVLLFFRPDWSPWNWYVNLEEPLRRTDDRLRHTGSRARRHRGVRWFGWRWKDEDDLAEAIRRGVIPADEEPRLRADGERAVRRILDREPPFDRDWSDWRPDPSWPVPALPEGWDRI